MRISDWSSDLCSSDLYGETIESVLQQIESARQAIANGASRAQLAELLPAGAARNAVDCALWDLEAQLAGSSVWSLLRLAPPQVLTTALTVSLEIGRASCRERECQYG